MDKEELKNKIYHAIGQRYPEGWSMHQGYSEAQNPILIGENVDGVTKITGNMYRNIDYLWSRIEPIISDYLSNSKVEE